MPTYEYSLGSTIWKDWVPTLTNMTASAITARYAKFGKTVHWYSNITVSAITGSDPAISVPVAMLGMSLGQAHYVDSGTSDYLGVAIFDTSTTMRLRYPVAATNIVEPISATAPFTWSAGDVIYLSGTYESA